jgi:hypothetical protein
VSVLALPMPADLARRLEYRLPRQRGTYTPYVSITPRGRDERRCAAYAADHYEVSAYYVASDIGSLGALEDGLKAVPGVYLTTQVHPRREGAVFTNPAWPAALGTARRDRNSLRSQVIALIRDERSGL